MKKNFKAILVGHGTMGKLHLERFKNKGVEFVNIYDKNCVIKNDTNIDFAVITTPAIAHYEYALNFLEKGIPVFLEKPIALRYNEAKILEKKSIEKQVPFFIAHSEGYNPAFLHFAKAFWSLKSFDEIHFFRTHPYSNRARDVNAAFDLMVHDIELFLTLCGIDFKIIKRNFWSDENVAELDLEVATPQKIKVKFYVNRDDFKTQKEIRVLENENVILSADLNDYKQFQNEDDALNREQKKFLSILQGAPYVKELKRAVETIKILEF